MSIILIWTNQGDTQGCNSWLWKIGCNQARPSNNQIYQYKYMDFSGGRAVKTVQKLTDGFNLNCLIEARWNDLSIKISPLIEANNQWVFGAVDRPKVHIVSTKLLWGIQTLSPSLIQMCHQKLIWKLGKTKYFRLCGLDFWTYTVGGVFYLNHEKNKNICIYIYDYMWWKAFMIW